jgi:hypothetical protein
VATRSLTSGDRRRWFRENSSIATYRYGITEQVISVTDIISEGPVQGLVHGGKSIYVNNDSLLSDDDTGYTSSLEETVTWTGSGNITLDNRAQTFLYNTELNSSNSERYLGIFNIMSFSGDATNSDATSITEGSDREIDFKATHVDITFNFATTGFDTAYPNKSSIVASAQEAEAGDIRDGIGVVSLIMANDRELSGYITQLNTTTGKITFRFPNNYSILKRQPSAFWLADRPLENFDIEITQFLDISSFTQNETSSVVGVTQNPAGAFANKRFLITPDFSANASSKYRGSSYQFRVGKVDQPPLQTLYGTGSTSVSLPSPGGMEKGVTKVIAASGAQAAEIDLVNIVFNYPGGLYGMNTENSDKFKTGAGYKIVAQFFRSDTDSGEFIDIDGDLVVDQTQHLTRDSDAGGDRGGPALIGGSDPHNLVAGDKIHTHGGKFTSSVSFNHVIDLEPHKPFVKFTLFITRVTNSGDITDNQAGHMHTYGQVNERSSAIKLAYRDAGHIDKWQAVQSSNITQVLGIIREKLSYPYTALANVTFSAKSFSDAPSRTYDCYGMKVLIPDNYTTREQKGRDANGDFYNVADLYSGIWRGSFRKNKVYTDNPAWIFYDILSNNRYGIGEFIDEDVEIDKYSLYKIARYCDELVPDGKGGLEPRFRANYYFQKSTDIYKVLKDMASNFRGMLYWMDGNIVPVIDEKKSPVYAFNSSNVLEGAFEYESTGSKTRTNQVVVSWNNPEADYKLEPLIIEDRENIIKTGTLIKETANAFGCTSEGQAIRYGRWKLWTAINQTEIVTFKTSINAAFLKPGDIVTVQDNHDHGYSYSGRVSVASSLNTFVLDRALVDNNNREFSAADMAGKKISILTFGSKVLLAQSAATINNISYSRGDAISVVMEEDGSPNILPPFTEISAAAGNTNVLYRISYKGNTSQANFNTAAGTTNKTYEEGDVFTYQSAASTAFNNTTTKLVPELDAYINNAYDDSGNLLSLQFEPEYVVQDFTIDTEGNGGYTTASNQIKVTENIWSNTEDAKGAIWGIKDDTVVSAKEYKIMSISHETDTTFAIVAVEYYESKFDAVDTDFTLAVPDASDPAEPTDGSISPPQNLRILRESTYSTEKDEFTLQWDAPTDFTNGVIEGYEIEHSVPGYDTPIRLVQTSFSFEDVSSDYYDFEVRSLSRGGKKSSPVSLSVLIDDIYGGSYDRTYGLLRGGKVGSPNSTLVNTEVTPAVRQFKYDDSPVVFMAPTGTSGSVTIDSSSGEIDFEPLVAGRGASWFGAGYYSSGLNAVDRAYVVRDGSQLKFINHIYDSKLGVEYWYDQLELNKQRYNENETTENYPNNPNIWVQRSGTVTIEENSNKIIGNGVNFIANATIYEFPTILKFSPTQAARISFIESETVAYLDRSFQYGTIAVTAGSISGSGTITYTANNHLFKVGDTVKITGFSNNIYNFSARQEIISKVDTVYDSDGLITTPGTFTIAGGGNTSQTITPNTPASATKEITAATFETLSYRPDFSNDHLIGYLDGPSGIFENYCFLDPDIQGTRSVTIDLNPAFIRFSGSGSAPTQVVDSNGDPLYSQILLTARALGFSSPEFIVSGSGFNDVSADAPTGYTAEATGVFTLVLDNATNLLRSGINGWQNGNSIDFTVTVRETGDPLNTTKIVSSNASIFRIQDGATGVSGRTVFLNSEDYSVLFDEGGGSPEYNGSSDNEIDLVATFNNFDDAIYKVTLKRPTGLGRTSESVVLYNWLDANDTTKQIPFVYAEGSGNTQWTSVRNSAQWPATFTIELAEKPSSGTGANGVWQPGDAPSASDIKATDSVSIAGVEKGQHGAYIVMPNNTHSYTTDKFGDIGTGSTAVIPNSGTTIEVLIGGEVGNYVGNSTAIGLPTGVTESDLNYKDWYFTSITHLGGDLTIGAISVDTSTDIVTIGPHTMTNSANKDSNNSNPTDNTEVIEYTIKMRTGSANSVQTLKAVQTLSKSVAGAEGATDVRLYLLSTTALSSGNVDYPTLSYTFSTDTATVSDTNQSWTTTYGEITAVNKYLYQLRTRVFPSTTTDIVTVSQDAANWEFAKVSEFVDSVTITSTSTSNGVTTVTFSDNTTITISDGDEGTSEGVLVVYADDASGTNKSATRGTGQDFVLYYEWTGTKPSVSSVTGTWVKFVGNDGDTEGVIPVYSTVASPTSTSQLSLSYSTQEYITFFEYTGTKPTAVTSAMVSATYVPFVGDDGTSISISSTSTSGGVTTVNFSDGTSITIDDGQTQGVIVFYADDASGTNQSTTQGTRTFVKYVEYTGTPPSSGGTSGFVQFIGDDGQTKGVIPVYSSVANPTSTSQLSLSPGTKEYVTFFEYTGNTPTSVLSSMVSATYVKFVGDDGVGTNGDDGRRTASGFVYNTVSTAQPTATSFSFSSLSFSGLTGGWTENPPEFNSTNNTIYYSRYSVIENVNNSGTPTGSATGSNITFAQRQTGTSFTGLVTFSSGSGNFQTDGTDIGNTTINGGQIKTNSITATQLQISNSTGASTAGINMNYNSGQPKIEISDGTNIRVVLGYLS